MNESDEQALATRELLRGLSGSQRLDVYALAGLNPREVAVVEHLVLGQPADEVALKSGYPREEPLGFLDALGDALGEQESTQAAEICRVASMPLTGLSRTAVLESCLVVAMTRIAYFGRERPSGSRA